MPMKALVPVKIGFFRWRTPALLSIPTRSSNRAYRRPVLARLGPSAMPAFAPLLSA